MNVRITVNDDEAMPPRHSQLDRIETLLKTMQAQLTQMERQIQNIMATEAEVKVALDKIDAATTKTAANVQAISDIAGTISTEVDALVAALKAAGVSQALVDQATALGTKADAIGTASDALVPVLQGIASKGVVNPVPIPVPPVPPAPATP